MKNIFKYILLLVLIIPLYISADCKDEELNEWATKAEVVFTESIPELVEDEEYAYFFSIAPTRDDIRFEVIDKNGDKSEAKYYEYRSEYKEIIKNDITELVKKYKINEENVFEKIPELLADGVITEEELSKYIVEKKFYGLGCYVSDDLEEETYTINIYGNDNSKCKNELLRKLTYTVPRYNRFEKNALCEEYPEYELCKTFTNKTKNMSETEFNKVIKEFNKKEKAKEFDISKIFENILNYLLYIIVPFVIATIIYLIRKRNIKKDGDND